MTPQSEFTVVAPVAAGRISELEGLLETMNREPGMADPANSLIPFGEFPQLHFARLTILADPTLGDIEVYGLPKPDLPTYLAFFGDIDGCREDFMAALVGRAEPGLRRIFAHCEGFNAGVNLTDWLRTHQCPVGANYVNTLGRTVQQIREEGALHQVLAGQVTRDGCTSPEAARKIRCDLVEFIRAEVRAGRVQLSDEAPTPIGWLVRHYTNLLAIPIAGLIAAPILLPLLPVLIYQLRRLEKTDPEIYPRPDVDVLKTLKRLEDHDQSNQYTALGSVKPGRFRRWLVSVVVSLIDWGARHLFANGNLARVQTIHFARWVFLDDKRRVMFASNYDGAHEAYMDDFINKVAFGLNLVFSNGVGWPRTDRLIKRGARLEQRFKYFQRRHQLPTQVWYKAYPGLTLSDIRRNQRIRQGLSCAPMTDAKVQSWLRLL